MTLEVGCIALKVTSLKSLALLSVRLVSTVRRDNFSGYLLVKDGFKFIVESNKVVINKSDVFLLAKVLDWMDFPS